MRAVPPALFEDYRSVPVHVLVREVPHAFGVLQECGVSVELRGCETLGQLEGLDAECIAALKDWVAKAL